MNSKKTLPSLCAVLIVLVFSVSAAHTLETWENVLERGFDDPRMNEAQAMTILGSHIYVASIPRSFSSLEHARILRATLRDDDVWHDFTPRLREFPLDYPVTDMIAFNDGLFVSVSDQLWRWGRNYPERMASWTRVDLPAPPVTILALGTVTRADTRRGMLCLLRGRSDVQTLCFFEDLDPGSSGTDQWHGFRFPDTARPDTVGSAILKGQGELLWAGLGGTTRGSGPCVVGKYSNFRVTGGEPEVGSMDLLSEDCFGTGVDFIKMEVFRDTPYFGIAGGGPGASDFRILRLARGTATPRDVTPWALFCPGLGGAPCEVGVPSALASMAVSGGSLYVGIRQPQLIPRDALVIVTRDGDDWTQSNEPGFGRDNNASVSAMTGRGCALYAGTTKVFNHENGFEVWRRGLFPDLHCIGDIAENVRRESQGVQRCISARVGPSIPPEYEVLCLPDFFRFAAFIEDIDLAFSRAFGKNPPEQILIDDVRKMLSPAFLELEKAKELVAQVDLAKSPGAARQIGKQAMLHVKEAAHIVDTTVASFKTALQHGGAPPNEDHFTPE